MDGLLYHRWSLRISTIFMLIIIVCSNTSCGRHKCLCNTSRVNLYKNDLEGIILDEIIEDEIECISISQGLHAIKIKNNSRYFLVDIEYKKIIFLIGYNMSNTDDLNRHISFIQSNKLIAFRIESLERLTSDSFELTYFDKPNTSNPNVKIFDL